jgi:protein tyrosine phosphatase (PTP) superfamily phosphohydrolase (DUF442 family)
MRLRLRKRLRAYRYGAVALAAANLGASTANGSPTQPSPDTQRPLTWAQPMSDTRVDNLHRITPTLYRSAKISADDVPALRALGIRKVVSFRAFHSDARVLEGSGITLQRIRINTWDIRDADMIAALKALRDVDRDGPVLIHCQHGADRTGLVSALYRVVYQGWSVAQAEDELLNGGYGFHPVCKNIKRYLDQVDVARLRQEVSAA